MCGFKLVNDYYRFMKKLTLFTFLTISVLGSIRAQVSSVSIPENAISVYGTIEGEYTYDMDHFYKVRISEPAGRLTNVKYLWINAGSAGEDMHKVDGVCEGAYSFEAGDKFIAVIIKSKKVTLNYETGEGDTKPCYRPILMRKL